MNWAKDCKFGEKAKTAILKNVQSEFQVLKAGTEKNDKDRVVIIDNTPFPADGAYSKSAIIVEFTATSSYRMSYNLRSTSIYMGIITMVLSFIIGMLIYLTIKVHRETKKKFLTDEDEEEESEEDQDKDEHNDHDDKQEREDKEEQEEPEENDADMQEVDLDQKEK